MLSSDSTIDFSIFKDLRQPSNKGRKPKNLIGHKFDRLTPYGLLGIHKGARWLCRCACGKFTITTAAHLLAGHTTSCGCYGATRAAARNTTHGQCRTLIYSRWTDMLTRCYNPKWKQYKDWGGRDITVCDRWRKFENFYADMGEPPTSKHQIDRINNNGNYEPANCRWATKTQQARNARNTVWVGHKGEIHCLAEWAEITGIKASILSDRLRAGWTIEKAFTKLPKSNNNP